MEIWEAADDQKQLVETIKNANHPHLAQASIWVLVSDAKPIVDNKVVPTETKRCTKTEKLKTGHDFKIIIRGGAWGIMTDQNRKIAIDEALCRCGVKYVPESVEVNGKKEIITDEIGRVVYTNQIATDDNGDPRWKINHMDAGIYFSLLQRYGQYNEDVENVQRALTGQPLKTVTAATQQVLDPQGTQEDVAEEASNEEPGIADGGNGNGDVVGEVVETPEA